MVGEYLSKHPNSLQVIDMAEAAHKPGWSFYEFFAGGGMARAGLGEDWACHFANDFAG